MEQRKERICCQPINLTAMIYFKSLSTTHIAAADGPSLALAITDFLAAHTHYILVDIKFTSDTVAFIIYQII